MAKPKIFISSTYYDLRYVRHDLERFIEQMGYTPILNDRGDIPYGRDHELAKYCYQEVENCDILISIIGGRKGSDSHDKNYSVSNLEVKKAIELNRQIYIFINHDVYSEYRTYLKNKNNNIEYAHVDDKKIFEFIEEVTNLNKNNNIHSFSTASDIIDYLKEQWAGLFQRYLSTESREKEVNTIQLLNNTSKTLNQLISLLINTVEEKESNNLIREILLENHPAFTTLRSLLNISFRVKFLNLEELSGLLSHLGYKEEEFAFDCERYSWESKEGHKDLTISFSKKLFDENKNLKIIEPSDWHNDLITLTSEVNSSVLTFDEDI